MPERRASSPCKLGRVAPIEFPVAGEVWRRSHPVPISSDPGIADAVANSPGRATHWLSEVDVEAFPPPMALSSEAEVVIIGGGLMGVSTAYWLASSGVNVLLVEAHRLAWGASARNAGLMLAS